MGEKALGKDAARFDFFPYAQEVWSSLQPPAVPSHFLYGRNMDTVNQLTFETADFQDIPKISQYVSGDGTVTAASAERLQAGWVEKGASVFLHGAPPGCHDEHLTIVSSPWLLDLVSELLEA